MFRIISYSSSRRKNHNWRLALNTLKKLKGDKFDRPLASIVLAKAIGLGATALNICPCSSATGAFGSYE